MSELINFYEHSYVKKYNIDYLNPNYELTYMKHPFYCGVIGPSGAGKTNMLMNLIVQMQSENETWTHIHIVYKEMENLYRALSDMCMTCIDGVKRNKIIKKKEIKNDKKDKNITNVMNEYNNELITFYSDLSLLPTCENVPQSGQQIIIFDDQLSEGKNKQKIIEQWFIRGRKTKTCGFSCIILSQSFFGIPKTIRSQFHYLIIIKITNVKDLRLILSTIGKKIDIELLEQMYNDATQKRGDFLKIDILNHDINKSFSHNFTDFYTLK